MRSRYERSLMLTGMEAWLVRQSNWVVGWVVVGLSLLFVLATGLLVWLLSPRPE